MINLKFIPLLVLLITHTKCDSSTELTEMKTVLNYNNPPKSELYVSIPVAVVYEEDRKEKNIESNVSSSNSSNSDNLVKQENTTNDHSDSEFQDKISPTNLELKTKKNNVSENNGRVIDNASPRDLPQNEYAIPVAVIYDPEPEIDKRTHSENKLRHRQRNRKEHSKITNDGKQVDIINNKSQAVEPNRTLDSPDNKPIVSKKRVRERDPVIPIIKSENYIYSHTGDFHYSYEGGDGTKAFMSGELRSINENAGEAVSGSYSYIGKDGKDYSLTYTADENGYRPVGDHLPTPPPIPPEIARALKYLATKTTPEAVTEALK